MSKWNVTLLVDSSFTVEVDADTKEGAIEFAQDNWSAPGLCHHCAGRLDMGDVLDSGHIAYKIEIEE